MNWSLLHKYLTRESTPAEKETLEQWINAEKRNKEFFDSLLKIWSIEPRDTMEVDAKAAWNSFKERLSDEEHEERKSQKPIYGFSPKKQFPVQRMKNYHRLVTISVAAAAVVLIAVLLYIFMPGVGGTGQQTAPQAQKVQEFSTELGQRASFRLADGTHVYLNAGSRMEISTAFGNSVRSVWLEGEAYFDVADNADVPFIVYSAHAYTKVLGTKFNVRSYPQDKQLQVVVEEGKVALGSSDNDKSSAEERILIKNQEGLLDSSGEIHIEDVPSLAHFVGWKDGKLVFKSTPFGEVIPRLERWYNIDITADSSLSSQQVTAAFDDEPMDEVLNILALSLDVGFEREGRTVNFSNK